MVAGHTLGPAPSVLIRVLADTLVERTHRTLDFGDASKRDVDSLRNWLAGNVALSRDSASYLLARDDLFCVVSSQDPVTKIEAMVEDGFICCLSGLYRVSSFRSFTCTISCVYDANSLLRKEVMQQSLERPARVPPVRTEDSTARKSYDRRRHYRRVARARLDVRLDPAVRRADLRSGGGDSGVRCCPLGDG